MSRIIRVSFICVIYFPVDVGVRFRCVQHVVLADADEEVAGRDVLDAVRRRDHPLPRQQRRAALVPELPVLVLPQAHLKMIDEKKFD